MKKRHPETGVYALVLQVPRNLTIEVGRLGHVEFASGVYVYVGSAMNSLQGRISRHLRRTKRKHWHIDYLVARTGVRLLGVAWRPAVRRIECDVSRAIQKRALTSTEGFGCSDCNCDSHLHRFAEFPKAHRALSQHGFRTSKDLP